MISKYLKAFSEKNSAELYNLLCRLFPLNRSITGEGTYQTLKILNEYIPFDIAEIESGSIVFDWEIPEEWNVTEAYIEDSKGKRLLSLSENNLHLMGYSIPVDAVISRDELLKHLIYDESRPDSIPYSTSYYNRNWAFCIKYNSLSIFSDEFFKIRINSTFTKGSLRFGEFFLNNNSDQEILISTYICHPSMANDSLSGIVLAVFLYKFILEFPEFFVKFNIRFLFAPETIGSLVYLFRNKDCVKERTYAGLVLTCLGDSGSFNYKKSFYGNQHIDLIAENILTTFLAGSTIYNYSPFGSDERQFGSPGFRLPIGVLTRSIYGKFEEYHTSKDNLSFVSTENLAESLEILISIIVAINIDDFYIRTNPFGEPHMSKYGLYDDTGGAGKMEHNKIIKNRMLVLNLCDGTKKISDIAKIANQNFFDILDIIEELKKYNLLRRL